MKKLFSLVLAAGLVMLSCKKNESAPESASAVEQTSNDASLEQDTKIYTSSKGDQLKVTYFAEEDKVAVKVQKNNEPEHKLTAKTVNALGNPVFTDDSYMWEMNSTGSGGKLSDKDGNAMEYREAE